MSEETSYQTGDVTCGDDLLVEATSMSHAGIVATLAELGQLRSENARLRAELAGTATEFPMSTVPLPDTLGTIGVELHYAGRVEWVEPEWNGLDCYDLDGGSLPDVDDRGLEDAA